MWRRFACFQRVSFDAGLTLRPAGNLAPEPQTLSNCCCVMLEPVKSDPLRFAAVRSASLKSVSRRSAFVRRAPRKFGLEKSAPSTIASGSKIGTSSKISASKSEARHKPGLSVLAVGPCLPKRRNQSIYPRCSLHLTLSPLPFCLQNILCGRN
jgi:hypothetical protein